MSPSCLEDWRSRDLTYVFVLLPMRAMLAMPIGIFCWHDLVAKIARSSTWGRGYVSVKAREDIRICGWLGFAERKGRSVCLDA
jgi:hypothetical protein